jgi:hypothetical protein
MSRRVVLGAFSSEEDILGVTRAARAAGLKVLDAYTPYAVHGLDAALGVKRSRLPWVCFAAGLLGAVVKLWFEYWTATVDWPMNVGGKPWNSLPAFVPVTFEVMVLAAGLTTLFTFFVVSRLRPGKRAPLPAAGITNDRFVLAIEETDASFDLQRVQRLFEQFHVISVREHLEEEAV